MNVVTPNFQVISGFDALQIRLLSTVMEKPVLWLYKYWIAVGEMTLLAGSPKGGKTSIFYSVIANITNGKASFDSELVADHLPPNERKLDALVWSGEDSVDVIKARLTAHGAQCEKIGVISKALVGKEMVVYNPAEHSAQLLATLAAYKPRILLMEPLTRLIKKDIKDPNIIREALEPIIEACRHYSIAFIGITHFSKSTSGKDILDRVYGSHVFAALPRMILGAIKKKNEPGKGVLLRVASNIAPSTGGYDYELVPVTYLNALKDEIETVKVLWGQKLEGDAQELADTVEKVHPEDENSRGNVEDEIIQILDELLKEHLDGLIPAAKIQEAGKQLGISWRTLQRYKKKLSIGSKKVNDNWFWIYQTGKPMVDRFKNDTA